MSWERAKLKNVCEFIDGDRGKNYPSNGELFDNGDCLFLNTSNVTATGFDFTSCQFITDEKDRFLRKGRLSRGDVVLTTRGTLGHVAYYSDAIPFDRVRINSGMLIARSNAQLLPNYLFYVFQDPMFQAKIGGVRSGSAQPQLPVKTLKEISIPVPALDEQERVIGILSSYDKLIENNRKQINLLEETAQRLYKEWFIDLHFPGYETTPVYNGLPDGWQVLPAESYCDIAIGKTPPRKEARWYENGTIQWASVADLGACSVFIGETKELINNDAIEQLRIKIAPAGSILLSFKMTIGRVAIASKPMATNEAIAHFKYRDASIREYLYEYLRDFQYSKLGSTSSISTAINSKIVKTMPLVLPKPDMIDMFHQTAAPIFDAIEVARQQISAAREARDRLLPKLMSGEIEVG